MALKAMTNIFILHGLIVVYDGLHPMWSTGGAHKVVARLRLCAPRAMRSKIFCQQGPHAFVRCRSAVIGPQRGPRHGRDPCRRACSATWRRQAAARARDRWP